MGKVWNENGELQHIYQKYARLFCYIVFTCSFDKQRFF